MAFCPFSGRRSLSGGASLGKRVGQGGAAEMRVSVEKVAFWAVERLVLRHRMYKLGAHKALGGHSRNNAAGSAVRVSRTWVRFETSRVTECVFPLSFRR